MLHVGHLNVFHLDGKLHDIYHFLHTSSPQFHLYGLTETRLHSDIPDSRLHIADYEIVRRDAQKSGETGIAAYIHSSISPHTHRRPDFEHKNIECVWLEFKHKNTAPPVFVCFLYRNPAAHVDWYDHFSEMLDTVYKSRPNADVLILGDLNIDLITPQPRWETIVSSSGLFQHITTPTRVTDKSSTLLDHIYSNNPISIVSASVSDLSISDHAPIFCSKRTKMPKSCTKEHTVIHYRSFKHFNKDFFFADLNEACFNLVYNHSDPDLALNCWYDIFLSILNKHAPMKTKRVKHPKLPPWITPQIMQAMAHRDQLKKSKQFQEYKKARNDVKNLVRDSKRCFFNRIVENSRNTTQIWRALNALTRNSAGNKSSIPSSLTADTFNTHFLSVPTSISQEHNFSASDIDNISDKLTEYCTRNNNHKVPFQIPPLTIPEVGRYISQLDNKKSSGPDEINNYLLKLSLPYIVESLTYIFNLCIQHNIFPTKFKIAKVIPLFKSQDMSDVNNYRPISLLPCISKLLEKHIHKHLSHYLEINSLIHPLQSGFRHNHSCSTALSFLTDRFLSAVNTSEVSGAVFLDLTKAFDLVNHSILINKLSVYLKDSESLPFFKSYLVDRTQRVYLHGSYSYEGKVLCGVPQGSVLGPILFCLYINDLPLHITDKSVQCHMLADDTTIETHSSQFPDLQHSLQTALSDISAWCKHNHMVINPRKSKSMVITTRQKHQISSSSLSLDIEGNKVEQVQSHKLLGLTIDDSLRWQPQIEQLCKRISKNLFLLSRLQSVISFEARKHFYNAHIKSHIDYASVLWDGCSDALFKHINSLHRRAAKLILPDPNLSTENKMETIGMLSLRNHLIYNKLVLMHKILNTSQAPSYLVNLFAEAPSRYSSFKRNLIIPKPRLDIYKTSLSFSGAHTWNSLPLNIKSVHNLTTFKTCLFKHCQKQTN